MSSLMKRRRRTTPVIYKQSTCVLAIGLVCLVTGAVFFLISVGAQLHLRLWQLLCVGFAGSGGVLVVVGGVWCGCSVHRDKVNNPASFYHHTMHNLTPSDYKTIGNLINAIRGRHFASNNELIWASESCYQGQNKEFVWQGIDGLENSWEECILLEDAYVK
ncbi:hypothetical protein CAPTEDRAFT_199971 [Capitella teleta]|uniref:Uncharacterized protein n=1 Tax=Capitella teleta TaxID=283909 RepID=R7TER9_CAPTE|nr:hypothetical protein CAPTEDRAFT_199971 [Capitella teleta]|eukprot:ELT92248.1 hypothetical protein CAPTEDRAFT_199971 [Capitella teleta]